MWVLGWGTLSFPHSRYCKEYTPWGGGRSVLKRCVSVTKISWLNFSQPCPTIQGEGMGYLSDRWLIKFLWLDYTEEGLADMVTQHPPVRQSWCRFRRMFLVVCLQWLNCLGQHKYWKFLISSEYGATQIVLQVVLSMEEDIIVFFKGGCVVSASISLLVYKFGGFLEERSELFGG